jgi:hypothetical protein
MSVMSPLSLYRDGLALFPGSRGVVPVAHMKELPNALLQVIWEHFGFRLERYQARVSVGLLMRQRLLCR